MNGCFLMRLSHSRYAVSCFCLIWSPLSFQSNNVYYCIDEHLYITVITVAGCSSHNKGFTILQVYLSLNSVSSCVNYKCTHSPNDSQFAFVSLPVYLPVQSHQIVSWHAHSWGPNCHRSMVPQGPIEPVPIRFPNELLSRHIDSSILPKDTRHRPCRFEVVLPKYCW